MSDVLSTIGSPAALLATDVDPLMVPFEMFVQRTFDVDVCIPKSVIMVLFCFTVSRGTL